MSYFQQEPRSRITDEVNELKSRLTVADWQIGVITVSAYD